MLKIVKVITQIIQKNRDAAAVSRMYQTEGDEPEDVQEIESIEQTGVQSRAPADSLGVVGRISAAYRVLIGHKDGVAPYALEEGERIAYASKDGAIVCYIHYKNDGTIEVDTDADLIANVAGSLTATVGGKTTLDSTGDTTITTPTLILNGDMQVNGTIDATGIISSEADVIADSAATAISALNHPHVGDLGFNTGIPVPIGGGVAPPGSPPSISGNDIVDGNGTKSTNHVHSSPAGGNTGTAV